VRYNTKNGVSTELKGDRGIISLTIANSTRDALPRPDGVGAAIVDFTGVMETGAVLATGVLAVTGDAVGRVAIGVEGI